ncbi:uncharacterized protein LOC127799568 [Diospyros lotus]|uniref:uncharacterized protein LOC127799568 n=1 Tax=Diospyros lotus TaxID=55363 RepID=UPI00225C20C6|nr:uncharacterized protein LOC127799568 [Diospyros lotus]
MPKMSKFNCFSALVERKKKGKGHESSSKTDNYNKKIVKNLQIRLERLVKSSKTDGKESASFGLPLSFHSSGNSRSKVKVMNHESHVEDEGEENLSMKRDNSKKEKNQLRNKKMELNDSFGEQIGDVIENKEERGIEEASAPKLKRSCSDLETGGLLKKMADWLPHFESESFKELQRLSERLGENVLPQNIGNPSSVMSHSSADKVMLKKHYSSQVLPTRSRRLWWRLFLRNMQTPQSSKSQMVPMKPDFSQPGGDCSVYLEPNRVFESPRSFIGESMKNSDNNDNGNQSFSGFHPQNQSESPITRVDKWVKELANQPPLLVDETDDTNDGIVFPPSPGTGGSPSRSTSHLTQHPNLTLSEKILHTNGIIQSTVAQFAGIGLKVIPNLSGFTTLRSITLSGNSIFHVTPGHLPKGLHTLNMSRNRISTIEGFRELTRLRVLDLSYNRIARIGHGLSKCTLVKELYLAGNKISQVEGLHRLLKVTALDLSFNKITTTKAIDQLMANYNSLQALNLLGNPIQKNVSDEHLRKALCSLLPKLAFLNKQPINPMKAREVATESIAKAALGSSSWSSRRKALKRGNQGKLRSSSWHRSSAGVQQRSRHANKTQTHHQSGLRMK